MARAQAFDLNALTPSLSGRSAGRYDWEQKQRTTVNDAVTVHLGDIATPLAEFLRQSESVVGCVAWITSSRLMDELVGKPVQLIVNKEWALRSTDMKPSAVRNRENLARLTGGLYRSDFPAPLSQVPGATNEPMDAVRCVGHSPRGRTPNNPLMHHKFVVRLVDGAPVAVWTGSFNFSVNAVSSIENAIEIKDPVIAAAYLAEWARVAAVSEPLEFVAGKASPSWAKRRPSAVVESAEPPTRRRAPRKAPVRKAPATTVSKTRARTATATAKAAKPTASKKTAPKKAAPSGKPASAAPKARRTAAVTSPPPAAPKRRSRTASAQPKTPR